MPGFKKLFLLTGEKKVFTNLQALRGIAALMVCMFHFRFLIENHSWTEIAFGNGWIGVQIFFMISGLLMVHTTKNVNHNYIKNAGRFALNRIIRIVPLYYIVTFISIIHLLDDGYLINHGEHLLRSLLFLPSFANNSGPAYGVPVLEVGWTLNYEMFFYFLFAISIFFSRLRYIMLFASFFLLIFIIPIISGYELSSNYEIFRNFENGYLNLITNPICIHFVFGALCGIVLPAVTFPLIFCRMMMVTSLMLFAFYYTGILNIEINAVYDLVFCGLLFISFVINDHHPLGLKMPSIIVFTGHISYSMYLLHPVIISYAMVMMHSTGMGNFMYTPAFFIILLAATLIISFFTYSIFEVWMTRIIKRLIFKKKDKLLY